MVPPSTEESYPAVNRPHPPGNYVYIIREINHCTREINQRLHKAWYLLHRGSPNWASSPPNPRVTMFMLSFRHIQTLCYYV